MQSASPGQTPGVSTRLRCCWHAGLAEPHNTGLRRGAGLRNFVDALPFEPTLPFEKLSGVAVRDPWTRTPKAVVDLVSHSPKGGGLR